MEACVGCKGAASREMRRNVASVGGETGWMWEKMYRRAGGDERAGLVWLGVRTKGESFKGE